ncbi:hypothetical protein COO60DRAFT_1634528 [Scenedesmus sp. NREL 46B-D3]|nr:hypothetical protein COO60DRAFT_1634528 [Scenedesmus sp. NREL 46B-D3]
MEQPQRLLPPAAEGSSNSSSGWLQEQQLEQQLPSLCGEPKNKLSIHRRGNRRISYYSQRKELFAFCKHCGQTGMPHQYFAANERCSGQCLQPPSKPYPREYKPPC